MQFDDLENDNISGSAEIKQKAAAVWLVEIQKIKSMTSHLALAELRKQGISIIKQQPRMAPLFNLVNRVLSAANDAMSGKGICNAAVDAIETTLAQDEKATEDLQNRTGKLLSSHNKIMTYSRSSLVISSLLALCRYRKDFQVLLFESRPMLEGKNAAKELTRAGIPTTIFVDAAMGYAVPNCDIILVGADAFTEKSVTNKIGTRALALLAREAGTPIYCLAASDKFIPANLQLAAERPRPNEEVWSSAPAGISIHNFYFENTPINLFTGVLTEHGFFDSKTLSFAPSQIDPWLFANYQAI